MLLVHSGEKNVSEVDVGADRKGMRKQGITFLLLFEKMGKDRPFARVPCGQKWHGSMKHVCSVSFTPQRPSNFQADSGTEKQMVPGRRSSSQKLLTVCGLDFL